MKKLCLISLLCLMAFPVLGGVGEDVTSPGDVVVGIPDNGEDFDIGWPGGEAPGFALDNDAETKFLHFLGEVEPTGLQVTTSTPGTIVGGLTFTTANDAPERDPMTWALYGSNTGIDGAYTLIASGDTFLPEDRFALNTSPIEFTPAGPFDHYQIMFPTVRDAENANSMQIAEIEILAIPEPTTICLLGLSGLAMLRRRRQLR